ncbi:alginate export family protein [Pseudotenacibaculum haliotis]|uniref:Alginate export family protein n=1 Tax=Pseudotenacibaculum haliotis TaxID=1862138 RepID=A0ABW5LQ03_9FLAO
MKFVRFSFSFLLFTILMSANAQVKVDAELRPRFEYRHGFKTLFPDNADPAAFISQRTRLKLNYKVEKYDFYISLQDIRVWGDVPQLVTADNSGLSIHQAWAKIRFDSNFALKIGRQEIIYDDSRFFGNVDWAQQARSHDVALLQYKKGAERFDIGFAFNQDNESLTGTTLTTPGTYKAFQYVWYHKDWSNFSASFLFLNNGLQFIDAANSDNNETRYSQTLGSHMKYGKKRLKFTGNFYYQFGSDVADNDLNAYLLGLDLSYKASDKTKLGLGIEIQSGNDNGAPSNGKNKAFSPFYGTNHKFNGLMDYFFVGNHFNNVGLQDIYVNSNFKLNAKSNLVIAYHNFSAQADLMNSNKKQLGSELDMVYSYKIQKDLFLKVGYSQLFPSEGMEILKGNTDGNTNNWGWVMLVVKPTIFNGSK